MNRKIVLTGLAVLLVAGSTAPASAQARRGSDIYISGDAGWYGGYGYYGPNVGVSVGFGTPTWGGDAYAAAPCTCGTNYRSVRVAPRYRSSTYAWGGGPYDYSYASYPYDYGGSYGSVSFGWSDDDWHRRSWRDGRRFDRQDRVGISNQTRFNEREIRGAENSRMSRASVNGESRTTTRAGAETRSGANSQFGSGTNPFDFTVRSGEETRGRREDVSNSRRTSRGSTDAGAMTRGGTESRAGTNNQFGSGTNPLDFTVRNREENRSASSASLRPGATGQTRRVGRRNDSR
jgi:hypothetical protein